MHPEMEQRDRRRGSRDGVYICRGKGYTTELYSDNQGCVNNWDMTTKTQGNRTARQKYATIWTKIEGVVQERTVRGSNTICTMHWIQSHVQDEQKGKSTGSKVLCACKKASRHPKECTVPGSEHHRVHEGNDEADRLARHSETMDAVCGWQSCSMGKRHTYWRTEEG